MTPGSTIRVDPLDERRSFCDRLIPTRTLQEDAL